MTKASALIYINPRHLLFSFVIFLFILYCLFLIYHGPYYTNSSFALRGEMVISIKYLQSDFIRIPAKETHKEVAKLASNLLQTSQKDKRIVASKILRTTYLNSENDRHSYVVAYEVEISQ